MMDLIGPPILIRGARQLLTLRGDEIPRRGAKLNQLNIIQDGALLVRGRVLEQVGPSRRVENLAVARNAIEVNAAGRVIVPGFVDSHTHLSFPLPGMPEHDHDRAVGLVRANSGKRLGARMRSYVEAMARHGTTTVEVKTGCGNDERAETKLLRSLFGLRCDPIDVVPTFLCRVPAALLDSEPEREETARWLLRTLLPKLSRRGWTQFVDVVCDGHAEHTVWFSRLLDGARSLGFSCRIHAAPQASSQAISLAEQGHVASIDHVENASPQDLARLTKCGTIVTLLPCSALRTGFWPPARALIEAGIPVALATNFNPLHSPNLNMQTAVALASMHLGMTVAEAISAATINGAHLLGRASETGSLEIGKSADLTILNISDYRDLAHHFGTNLVHLTMKRGDFIYREGKVAPLPAQDFATIW